MTCNNLVLDDISRLREMSATEHLRNSIYKHPFCEQDSVNCQFLSWDVTGNDQSGSEEN